MSSSSGASGASGRTINSNSSSSGNLSVRAKYVVEAKNKDPYTMKAPANVCIVINIIFYLKPFCKTLIRAEPLENIGSDIDRAAFIALRTILAQLESGRSDPINLYPFLDKFCLVVATTTRELQELDVPVIMDRVIKLITVVIPPLREVFLGRISSSLDIPGWMNLESRCFHAQFLHPAQSLESVMRSTLLNYEGDVDDDDELDDELDEDDDSERFSAPADRIRAFNAKILYRAPEILVFAVESAHLPQALRFTEFHSKDAASAENKAKQSGPDAVRFPASFDVSVFLKEYLAPSPEQDNAELGTTAAEATAAGATGAVASTAAAVIECGDEFDLDDDTFAPKWYDLASVVTLEGAGFERVDAFYRLLPNDEANSASSSVSDNANDEAWFHGCFGASHEPVTAEFATARNYFQTSEPRRVHPRLLIYTKRGISAVLQRLKEFVTKAGQMRSLGDATFESAETPEHYDEAKHYYEEAIIYDETLRTTLQERLQELEQIERNQRAHSYETQADISLGRRRFKEACDLYKSAMRSAVVNSSLYLRIREKEDYMMKIISLEIANHLTEKGLDCVKSTSFIQAKEHFAQALKLNPNYVHLHSIIAGIEQSITEQSSALKVTEANQAMKVGKYKLANQLFQDAIALIPERQVSLQAVLDSLVGLMQGEEALIKQRAGLVALEDKKYTQAIDFITQAIKLLPAEAKMEHGFFLCDRAQVYFELKEYETAINDCQEALKLRPDLAIAYLRLGSSQFELGQFDAATSSYERAIRNDASLTDQVKVKVRQVNTAKEVLQRKEREAERARIKEEERKQLEERRAREESAKLLRQQKLAQEQAEKAERLQLKEEEKHMRTLLQREGQMQKEQNKVAEKDRIKREKAARDTARAQERERAKAEKERERERVRQEKELKLKIEREAKQQEEQRRLEFAAEMEKAQARQKELEREKEAEKEKARLEMERTIAEREKARREKLAEGKKSKSSGNKERANSITDGNVTSAERRNSFSSSSNEAFPSLQSAASALQSTTASSGGGGSAYPGNNSGSSSAGQQVNSLSFVAQDFSGHLAAKGIYSPAQQEVAGLADGSGGRGVARQFHGGGADISSGSTKWSSLLSPAAATSPPPSSSASSGLHSSANLEFNGSAVPLGLNYDVNRFYGAVNTAGTALNNNPPPQPYSEVAMGGGGYNYRSGGGSAWADHERAMLEATAARMSEKSNSALSDAVGSTRAPVPAPDESDQVSSMLAKLRMGSSPPPSSSSASSSSSGGGVLASLRSGSGAADFVTTGGSFRTAASSSSGALHLSDIGNFDALVSSSRGSSLGNVGSLGLGMPGDSGNYRRSASDGAVTASMSVQSLRLNEFNGLSANDESDLNQLDTFSSLLDGPKLPTGLSHLDQYSAPLPAMGRAPAQSSALSSLTNEYGLGGSTSLGSLQGCQRRSHSDQLGSLGNSDGEFGSGNAILGHSLGAGNSSLQGALGNSGFEPSASLHSLLDISSPSSSSILSPGVFNADHLLSQHTQQSPGLRELASTSPPYVDFLHSGGGGTAAPSLIDRQLGMLHPTSVSASAFDTSLGSTSLQDGLGSGPSDRGFSDILSSMNMAGADLSSQQSVLGQRSANSLTPPLSSWLLNNNSPPRLPGSPALSSLLRGDLPDVGNGAPGAGQNVNRDFLAGQPRFP